MMRRYEEAGENVKRKQKYLFYQKSDLRSKTCSFFSFCFYVDALGEYLYMSLLLVVLLL